MYWLTLMTHIGSLYHLYYTKLLKYLVNAKYKIYNLYITTINIELLII